MLDNSLVAAKKEYTDQLTEILSPLIIKGVKSIWDKCLDNDNRKPLRCFQERLASVPIWNQTVIDNEYKRIIDETGCNWLDKLIKAVFLSNVKVLSTVRVGKTKTIHIKVPETKTFIHKCYIECARALWQEPKLIDNRNEDSNYNEIKSKHRRLYKVISESIEKAISKNIPIQTILENYINDVVDDEDEDDSQFEEDISHNIKTQGDDEIKEENNIQNVSEPNSFDEVNEDNEDNEDNEVNEDNEDNEVNDDNEVNEDSKKEDDVFMKEPQLYVSGGNDIQSSSENFEYGKNIKINNKEEVDNSPFFSDSESEEE